MSPCLGISTSNSIIKLPSLLSFSKKGIPIPLTVFFYLWVIMSPFWHSTVRLVPSRCFSTNLNPVKDSYKLIFLVMNRSAPTRVKMLCFLIWTMKMRSPDKQSGNSSPSPGIVMACPCGTPFSTGTSTTFSCSSTFSPLQVLHLFFSSMILPSPLQGAQLACICWYIPGPSCNILTTDPFPLQSVHVFTSDPPFPWQVLQFLYLVTGMLTTSPLNADSKVISRAFLVGLTFCTLLDDCLPMDPPINMLIRSDSSAPAPPKKWCIFKCDEQ